MKQSVKSVVLGNERSNHRMARPVLLLAVASVASALKAPLYCLNVQLCVKPERRDEFLATIKANQAGTLSKEPLAVTYLFGEDEGQPNTFHFFEQYEGRTGFEAHTQTPHFAEWEEFASTDPFTSPPVVSFYEEDSPGRVGPAGALAAEQFCLHVAMHVKPERRDEFLDALRADQMGALDTESACAAYLFGEDQNEPNTFHMFEAYTGGRAGFAAHSKTPHYTAWADFKATEPFAKPATVSYYTMIAAQAESRPAPVTAPMGGDVAGAAPAGFEWGGVY